MTPTTQSGCMSNGSDVLAGAAGTRPYLKNKQTISKLEHKEEEFVHFLPNQLASQLEYINSF